MVIPITAQYLAATDPPLGTFTLDGHRYAIHGAPPVPGETDLLDLLTPREFEIATLIACGRDSKVIARRLNISCHTVGAHVARIYAKLGLHKRTQLTARVVRRLAQGHEWRDGWRKEGWNTRLERESTAAPDSGIYSSAK